jgi:putative membrane protein
LVAPDLPVVRGRAAARPHHSEITFGSRSERRPRQIRPASRHWQDVVDLFELALVTRPVLAHVSSAANAAPMPEKVKVFIQRWIISTVAVLVATYIVPGIKFDRWQDLLIAKLVLGLLNTFLRPLLMLLSMPLLIFTLGLFSIVINAVLLLLVSALLGDHFRVAGFWSAFFGAFIISIVSLLLNSITRTGDARVSVRRGKPPEKHDDDKGGPVIDV